MAEHSREDLAERKRSSRFFSCFLQSLLPKSVSSFGLVPGGTSRLLVDGYSITNKKELDSAGPSTPVQCFIDLPYSSSILVPVRHILK